MDNLLLMLIFLTATILSGAPGGGEAGGGVEVGVGVLYHGACCVQECLKQVCM